MSPGRLIIVDDEPVILRLLSSVFEGEGYEIVGLGWHQGWNDRVNQAYNDEYEKNMANFIRDVRKELGIERLPFVIAGIALGLGQYFYVSVRVLPLLVVIWVVGLWWRQPRPSSSCPPVSRRSGGHKRCLPT